MNNRFFEPLNDNFDGIYIGSNDDNFIMPPNDMNLSGIAEYMKKTHKKYQELSDEEIERFRYS